MRKDIRCQASVFRAELVAKPEHIELGAMIAAPAIPCVGIATVDELLNGLGMH